MASFLVCQAMRWLTKFIGLILLLVGFYFLGRNIIFTTRYSPYWYRDISAAASVICTSLGILSLVYFPRTLGALSWGLIGLGIVFVFASGWVILRPTSLWYFFLGFGSMAGGLQLLRTGRIGY